MSEIYTSWLEVKNCITSWAASIVAAKCATVLTKNETEANRIYYEDTEIHLPTVGLMQARLAKDPTEALIIENIHKSWMLSKFMESFPPLVRSPQGEIALAPWPIYDHADKLSWCLWDWDIEKAGTFKTILAAAHSDPTLQHSLNYRFPCIDTSSGIVVTKHHNIQLLASAMGDQSDTQEAQRMFEALVRPYLGWSLCWDSDELPNDWPEILAIFQASDFLHFTSDIASTPEKGAGVKDALDCLLQIYPEGKQRATWGEVETKTGYSRRQITRALDNFNRRDWLD